MTGRALCRLFCIFYVNLPLEINAKWIAGNMNQIDDLITCLKKEMAKDLDSSLDLNVDYSLLISQLPQLVDCCFYQPNPKLLDAELANSINHPEAQTQRTPQADYLTFCSHFHIPVSQLIGCNKGYEDLLAYYKL